MNMIQNAGKLAGKTIFITGASRGIGKAIAEKCARDGANIIIAAKTVKPHPKLQGTIYTAADDLEKMGGKCLPCEVDIRDEEQVKSAVDKAVEMFGGIDFLVNNASAIQLSNTPTTEMKKFDLMFGVNTRGTYMCSKYCLPHLKKSKHAKILNISPPLAMQPHWFKDHVAYTMAKYGMSMCVLGMAEEFKKDGVSVNALWPRTAIYTAAMEMLGDGDSIKNHCRKPDIVSDAAYVILTNDDEGNTGNFYIDDDVLSKAGVTDLASYSYVQDAKLLPDFFLEDSYQQYQEFAKSRETSPSSTTSSSTSSENEEIARLFGIIKNVITPELVKIVESTYLFELADDKCILLDLKTQPGEIKFLEHSEIESLVVDSHFKMESVVFQQLFNGQISASYAFMTGSLELSGSMEKAMQLQNLMKSMKAKL